MRRLILFTAAWLILGSVGSLIAQETSGTIRGRIVDAQGLAVPGVNVTATGPQGAKSATTETDGRFAFPFLTPGTYSVRAELQGFKSVQQQNLIVGLGQILDLPLKMEVGGLTETVQITAASPVVDTTSTTVGGVLDPATLRGLPIGRNITDALYVLPGVSDSSGAGRANPSIGGASGLENNYIVDGVNITDTGFGGFGAFNATFGSLGMGVTSDFVKETQVKTGGFEAEYGQTTGGVVNVVTKSGGNLFSGGAFGYSRPSQAESSWKQLSTPNGTVNTTGSSQSDVGISTGGPIVHDKLFFFATYNPQWQNRSFEAPAGFPYSSLGSVDRKRRIQSYAGKLTAQAGDKHRLDLSVFGDPSKGLSGLQQYATLRRFANPGVPGTPDVSGGFSSLEYGGNNQTFRYDGIMTSKWLLEGALAHASQKFNETPTVNQWQYTDLRTVPQGRTGGLGFFEQDKGRNTQFSAKSTHIFGGGGRHQIRYGVEVQDIKFTRATDYSGPPLTLADGRTTLTGGPVQIRSGGGVTFYRATRGLLVQPAETSQLYTSVFLQDSWQAGRLTVTPGVRWERQHLQGPTPGGSLPVVCHADDTRPGEGNGTGAPIPCSYTWAKNWAPRIGATYDIAGKGSSKVYASWGRFYAKIPNDLAARSMWADTGITRQDYVDAALTQPIKNGVSYGGTTVHLQTTSAHAAIIEPGTKGAYTDEFLAGYEFEVLNGASLGIRYVHRKMPQILEDIGQLSVVGYFIAPDTPVDYFITNPNANTAVVQCCGYNNVSFENPVHNYDAIEVTLNKRFTGRWGAITSYRYSRLKGNFEGFYRSDNGQTDPAISSLYDFPTNDPSYTGLGTPDFGFIGDIRYQGSSLGQGVLPNDRPHQLKVFTNYAWSDLNLGVGITAGSGASLTSLASNPVYNNAGEIPTTIRGGGFQTVDGFKTRTPMDAQVDLHVDYRPTVGGRKRFTVGADVFNLFNRQAALNYDNWFETAFDTPNPNFAQPTNGGGSSIPSFQAPLGVRVGIRYDW